MQTNQFCLPHFRSLQNGGESATFRYGDATLDVIESDNATMFGAAEGRLGMQIDPVFGLVERA